jgi:hypothetical protein
MITVELDRTRHLKFTPNALADAEERMGVGYYSMIAPPLAGIRTIRCLLWAGLKWEDRSLTPEKIGNILDEVRERDPDVLFKMDQAIADELKEGGWFRVAIQEDDIKNGE